MPQSVKLSDELIKQARHYGDVYHRSTAKQIEYWSTIGKISEENPDLPYSFIKDILLIVRIYFNAVEHIFRTLNKLHIHCKGYLMFTPNTLQLLYIRVLSIT